jgi:hypothetical protein
VLDEKHCDCVDLGRTHGISAVVECASVCVGKCVRHQVTAAKSVLSVRVCVTPGYSSDECECASV